MSNRNILAYFIDSKIWKAFEARVVNNIGHWLVEDKERAARMVQARAKGKEGYTTEELLYDMLECIHSSNLKPKTKSRLYTALDELESYHIEMKTHKNQL